MKRSELTIRSARESDILDCLGVTLRAVNDLRRRNGLKPFRFKFSEPPPLFLHLLRSDPDGAFVAVRSDGTIVGYTSAITRDDEWFLAQLHVEPSYQSKGVGRKLLERALRKAVASGCSRRALVTFAYNPTAVALYSRYGMTPQSPILVTRRERSQYRRKLPRSASLKMEPLPNGHLLKRLTKLDKKVRGIARPEEHFFWGKESSYAVCVLRDGTSSVGYVVLHKGGIVGPVAVTNPRYLCSALSTALGDPFTQSADRQIVNTNGENSEVVRLLLSGGFIIEEVCLTMSDQRLSDPLRYIPGNLAHF